MNRGFNFLVLAVTKTYAGYCIAGMDNDGNWIRPLPVGRGKFWGIQLDGRLIKVGDIWEISDYVEEYDETSPGHTEDIRLRREPIFKRATSNDELIEFVTKHQEHSEELAHTLNAKSRSLCLVGVEEFHNFMGKNSYSGKLSARMTFESEGENHLNITSSNKGFPITDLKWRAYTIQEKVTATKFDEIFVCIGLARTEPAKGIDQEYPMVISVITNPEVLLLPTYPN